MLQLVSTRYLGPAICLLWSREPMGEPHPQRQRQDRNRTPDDQSGYWGRDRALIPL